MTHTPQHMTAQANAIPTGLLGSEQALQGALSGSIAGIEAGAGFGNQLLDPFSQGGQQAFNLQGALSGAQGAPAQQQAFADFRSSPGQEFLRNQGEQALLRNQAAIGGLGGGNVRSALQQQGIGFAAQDFGNQFDRLGQVSGLGGALAGNQAGLNFGAGRDVANLAFNTGQSLSSGRTRAGEQIAGQIGSTTTALSNLINQQGSGLSDIIGAGGGNLANLLSGAGQQQALSQEQLATILANISTGQGSQIAGIGGVPGVQQTPGNLSSIANIISAFGTL